MGNEASMALELDGLYRQWEKLMGLSKRLSKVLQDVTKHSVPEHLLQGTEGQAAITTSLHITRRGACVQATTGATQVQSSRVEAKLPAFRIAWAHDREEHAPGKAKQRRSEGVWMAAAQVQMNHPFFFGIVSFHVCLFPWISRLSPLGNLVGIESEYCVRLSRVSTCPSGLSDSWAAEHPEIQDRSTAHWGGELYSMHALCLMNQKIVRPAVHMLCR